MQTTWMHNDVVSSASGLITGVAAGFVGVGGGEFRIPVLVSLLRLPLKLAGGVNLVVGFFTVALGAWRRWGSRALAQDDLVLIAVMGLVSLAGAAVGVANRERMDVRPLKIVFCVYLLVIGVWMVYESVTGAEHVLLQPAGIARWSLAGLIGFVIAAISGVLGVAGGEMRIPALLYRFGVPVVEAGTISLAVSIPTVASGAAEAVTV